VVYKMLGLTVEALLDGSLKVSGAFGEETGVWAEEKTSRRSFTNATPPRLEFTLISKSDKMETSFELGHHNFLM